MHQYYATVAEWPKARVCKTLKPSVRIWPVAPNMEVWMSGLNQQSWKLPTVKGPWVRISPLPPNRRKNVDIYNNADNGILLGIVWCCCYGIFIFDVWYSNNFWSVGRVGRRHFPAKKAYLIRVSLVRIQYTPPLDKVFFLVYNGYITWRTKWKQKQTN